MEETPKDGKQLPGVDRETRLRLVPAAGSDERAQMRPPTRRPRRRDEN